jgi:hypothetical protein
LKICGLGEINQVPAQVIERPIAIGLAGTVRTPEINIFFVSGVSFSAITENPDAGGLFSHSLDLFVNFWLSKKVKEIILIIKPLKGY